MDIVLIHGYNVTSTSTYGVLPQRLKGLGHSVKHVYLAKYVTLDDDLTLPDIVRAFQSALTDTLGPGFEKSKFVCITHSTGGLVARAWVHTYYSHRPKAVPFSHLIMLAPPNNGSRLASLGKSRLSRLRNLWGAEPGLKILNALELGSSYQWDLNSAWMDKQYHTTAGFFPVVITGQWIDKKLWDVIVPATYERGSDGVVRAASANLNMKKYILLADGSVQTSSIEGVPFLLTRKTSHSDDRYGIMGSIPSKGGHAVLDAIIEVLGVDSARSYRALYEAWAQKSALLQQQEGYYDGTPLDSYCQLIFNVRDTNGDGLVDYAIELIDIDNRGDRMPSGFMSHSFQNSVDAEVFVYYLNFNQISKIVGGQLGFKIQSVVHSPLIRYDEKLFKTSLSQVGRFISANQTTYVQVQMNRRVNKNTFRLTENFSHQKIKAIPSEDWIS